MSVPLTARLVEVIADRGELRWPVFAAAVLRDGRVVRAGGDGRVLAWNPAQPGSDPVELGRHDGPLNAVAVFLDGRVVSAGFDKRVLVWDPGRPGGDPVELGRHDTPITSPWVRCT